MRTTRHATHHVLQEPGSPFKATLGRAVAPFPAAALLALVTDMDKKKKWDKLFKEGRRIEDLGDNTGMDEAQQHGPQCVQRLCTPSTSPSSPPQRATFWPYSFVRRAQSLNHNTMRSERCTMPTDPSPTTVAASRTRNSRHAAGVFRMQIHMV